MESSTLPATTLFTLSKTIRSSTSKQSPFTQLLHRHISRSLFQKRFSPGIIRCFVNADSQKSPFDFISNTSSSSSIGNLYLTSPPPISSTRLASISASAASSGGGGGDGIIGSGNGGHNGGGGNSDGFGGGGGENKVNSVIAAPEEVYALSPDVIILDVGGMTCGGCAASVKRILESQPQVSSANVNLATETAIIWPVAEAKSIQNWQQQLGETLAKHLSNCGFKSNLRDSARDSFFRVFEKKMDEKHNHLKESGRELAVSWALCAVCLLHYLVLDANLLLKV